MAETGGGSARAVALVGATGAGKSAIAGALARRTDGEIIACDSVQVYRGFDIGTAKPSVRRRREIPHHVVDVASWWDPFWWPPGAPLPSAPCWRCGRVAACPSSAAAGIGPCPPALSPFLALRRALGRPGRALCLSLLSTVQRG